jgi:hypothetical protein
MPNTTSRLALLEPVGADAVSELRLSITNHATTLDNAAIYTEGTLASRTIGEHGEFYRTTDAGAETLSWTDGSVWLPLGLIPAIKSASASAISGQAILTSGASAITITLPAHAAGQIVAVKNGSTGGTTVSGSSIQGLGLSAASTFSLGAVGSFAVLIDDGTSWHFLAGQQDTGWVAVTLASGFTGTAAYARLKGDTVSLKGGITNGTGAQVTSGTTLGTMPAFAAPAAATPLLTATTTSGVLSSYLLITGTTLAWNANVNWGSSASTIPLAGAGYSIS